MLAANYILCRALVEILSLLKPANLQSGSGTGSDLGVKLEDMVIAQVKAVDADVVAQNENHQLSCDIFAEVLAQLAALRFTHIK